MREGNHCQYLFYREHLAVSTISENSNFRSCDKNSNVKFDTAYVGTKIVQYPCFGWSPLYYTVYKLLNLFPKFRKEWTSFARNLVLTNLVWPERALLWKNELCSFARSLAYVEQYHLTGIFILWYLTIFLPGMRKLGLVETRRFPPNPTSLGREGVFFPEWKEASQWEWLSCNFQNGACPWHAWHVKSYQRIACVWGEQNQNRTSRTTETTTNWPWQVDYLIS
jgi:hypothetical protein